MKAAKMKRFTVALATVAMLLVMAIPAVSAHAAMPFDAYPCQNTAWYTYTGSPMYFEGSSAYILQAKMQVLVDPDRTNPYGYRLYCGQVRAGAHDTLEGNCIAFNGNATTNNYPQTTASSWDVFHCTQQAYDFWGAVANLGCPSGDGLYAVNSTDSDPYAVSTPTYWC